MQKMTIILFAMAILLKPVLPVMEYFVNYDYITKELCINKDKKNLHCNGKCHLKSKLAEASDTAEKNLPDKKSKPAQIEVLFFTAIADLLPQRPMPASNKPGNHYSDFYSYAASNRIFHPPSYL